MLNLKRHDTCILLKSNELYSNLVLKSKQKRNIKLNTLVSKCADLSCFLWNKKSEKWEANYSITEIYDHI